MLFFYFLPFACATTVLPIIILDLWTTFSTDTFVICKWAPEKLARGKYDLIYL